MIEESAFENSELESINIPKSVKKIARNCFSYCKNLKAVTFSCNGELEIIEKNAFMNTAIQTISIPPSVKTIEDNAFSDLDQLKIININQDSNLTSFSGAFRSYYQSLEKIISPISFVNTLLMQINRDKKFQLEITDDIYLSRSNSRKYFICF